jgi:hypothetical protein
VVPPWLHALSLAALVLGLLCALAIAVDVVRRPQCMGIMNLVWPVDALFGTLPVAWAYFRLGRLTARDAQVSGASSSRSPSAFSSGRWWTSSP